MTFAHSDSGAEKNELAEGDRKLQSVINQWREVRRGLLKSIHCPYCSEYSKPVDAENNPADWIRPMISPFCCDLLQLAAFAIIERMGMQEKADQMKRIQDSIDAKKPLVHLK